MLTGSPFSRAARPVADVPLDALADTEELAKGWLLLLLAQAPLSAAASVPAADLAREAPDLCGAMTAAIASDAELDRLRPAGDRAVLAARAGALAGAVDPAGAAAAVSALRGVVWSALLERLVRPDPEQVAALAARLALVADVIIAAALAPADAVQVPGPSSYPPATATEPPATAPPDGGAEDVAVPQPPEAQSEAEPPPAPPPDDHPVADEAADARLTPRLIPVPDSVADDDRWVVDPGHDQPIVPPDVFPSVIAAVGEERHEPWATAVVRRLGRLVAEGVPCSVLAVEVDDADRLLAADLHGEAHAALDRIERALRDELRPGDAAVRERVGRVWVVAQAGGIEGARALGRRLADAVAGAGSLHGAPLSASIGIAACPDDGGDPTSLVAHADEGVFAARAAGVTIA